MIREVKFWQKIKPTCKLWTGELAANVVVDAEIEGNRRKVTQRV